MRLPSRAGNHAREPRRRDTPARTPARTPAQWRAKQGRPVPPFAWKEAHMTETDPAAEALAAVREEDRADSPAETARMTKHDISGSAHDRT